MADIYIHVDADGCYQGNGGQLMLTLLANELHARGKDVAIFDAQNRLNPRDFSWLEAEWLPPIAPLDEALTGRRIISSWLQSFLFASTKEGINKAGHSYAWMRESLRYWCQDELLRVGPVFDLVRFAIINSQIPTVISNGSNLPYYHLEQMVYRGPLDIWIRGEFQDSVFQKEERLVGIQDAVLGRHILEKPGRRAYSPLLCRGSQSEVWARMNSCTWFLSWQEPKNLVFEGEGFGLALHEALACGCKCVARRTPNLAHLEGIVAFADTLEEAVGMIGDDTLVGDGAVFIDAHYRMDSRRREVIERWLA